MTRKTVRSSAKISARKVAKATSLVLRDRAGRSELKPGAFTRAAAEKLLASTDSLEVCTALSRHTNGHVKAKAAQRAELLVARDGLVSEVAAIAV